MAYLRSKSQIINLSASVPLFGGVTVHEDVDFSEVNTILSASAVIYRIKYNLIAPDTGQGYDFWKLQFSANAEACRNSAGMNTVRATVFLYYNAGWDKINTLKETMLPNCAFQLYCVAVCE